MAPTAEEAVVEFAREKLKSYKHLPVNFYQIGEKYRHEIRTRGYMLRGKSFLMMDAYSFDEDFEGLEENYRITREAYLEISKRLHLNAIPVVADNGDMGGKKSEEFMVISPIGEDTILYDEKTGIGLNTEILDRPDYKEYLKAEYNIDDISNLKEKKTIEIGHIFQLGTRYSETMNATFTAKDGTNKPYVMGCYGIGVSRVMAAIYENSRLTDNDGKIVGISLPKNIAPYIVQIIPNSPHFDYPLPPMFHFDILLLINNLIMILLLKDKKFFLPHLQNISLHMLFYHILNLKYLHIHIGLRLHLINAQF
jgi:prolyl-tRNA synthetase